MTRAGSECVKSGKKPTRNQKKLMQEWNLNPADWLVERDTPEEMHLIHRFSDSTRKIIPKR